MEVDYSGAEAPPPGTAFDEEAAVVALSSTMTEDGQQPIIEIYGRTRNARSFLGFHEGFFPFFFALDPTDVLRRRLDAESARVVETTSVELYHQMAFRPALKIVLRRANDTPEFRQIVREANSTPLAADIPFTQRFMFTEDLGYNVRVRGRVVKKRRREYQSMTQVEVTELIAVSPFRVPLSTLSFDIENSIKDERILCIGLAFDAGDGHIRRGGFRADTDGGEKAIIETFQAELARLDPDVVTGYNVAGYDLPHIEKRCKELGIRGLWDKTGARRVGFTVSREGSELKPFMGRYLRAVGRVLTDTWWNVKREVHPKQETLQAVAMELLNEGKGDVDASQIDAEWDRSPSRVFDYCMRDAELTLRIHQKIQAGEKYQDLAAVAKLAFDETINGRTSTLIDSILIRAADREKVAVPMSRREDRETPIEGGYVHQARKGIHNWVCVLDFKSMYPSIMIKNNICFTTFVGDDSASIKAPNGVSYQSREERPGLLPRILEQLLLERDRLKVAAKRATTEEQRRFLTGLQDSVKVLMNSFYGVMASSFYRFTNPKIGESITAFARKEILSVISQLQADGIDVIYSDTDSVFFVSPTPGVEPAVAIGKNIAARFTQGGLTMEFEKVLNPFFTHGAKKRYVGRQVWPRDETIVRGYEIRRTDSFDWQSDALNAVFERLMAEDIDQMLKTAIERVQMVKRRDVPISALVISRSVRDIDDYDSKHAKSLQNVKVMMKLKDLKVDVQPGMKVSWVVTGEKGRQDVTPYLGSDSEAAIRPDWEYYARRTAMTLARVTEGFDWSVEDLLRGEKAKGPSTRATTLDVDAETAADADPQTEPSGHANTERAESRTKRSTGRTNPKINKDQKTFGDINDVF